MKKHILLSALIICYIVTTCFGDGMVLVGGGSPSFTGLFYSDFNDELDDAQWTTTPTGWNDDYNVIVLEGAESGFSDGPATSEVRKAVAPVSFSENTTSYTRTRFRVSTYGTGGTWAFGITLSSAGSLVASCSLNTDTDSVNALLVEDSTGADTIDPADDDFSDGTYFLYMIYNDDTSVTCEVRDSTFTLVTGWEGTNTTNAGEIPDSVEVYVYRINVDIIWDTVECREDTNWGN